MKLLKYLVAAAAVLAIALTLVYQRRDSIARDIANSLLGGTAIRIVAVDLDTLLASRVAFERLELELANGTRIVIKGLDAPLSFPSLQPEYVAIRELRVTSRKEPSERTAIAPAVRTFFDLPRRFPRAALTVERLLYDDYPEATNLVWNLADELQRLHFGLADLVLRGEAVTTTTASYLIKFAIDAPDRVDALTLELNMIDEPNNPQVRAYGSIDTASLSEPLRGTDLMPDTIQSIHGTVYGTAGLRLDDGTPGTVSVALNLATDGNVAARTNIVADQTIEANVSPGTPMEVRFRYPDGGWSIQAPRSIWSTDLPGFELMQLRLTDVECTDTLSCTLDLGAGPAPLTLAGVQIERALLTAPITITAGETVTAELLRDPSIFLSGIRVGSLSLGSVTATRFDGSALRLDQGNVSGNIESLSMNLTNVAAKELTIDALALQLRDIVLRSGAGIDLSASLRLPARSGTFGWRDYSMRNPEVDGSAALKGDRIEADVSIADGRGALAARASLRHDLNTRAGELLLSNGAIDFTERQLSGLLGGLPETFDLVGGRVGFDGRVTWRSSGAETSVAGSSSLAPDGLLARYRDIAATGVGGNLDVSIDDAGLLFGPSSLSARLIDVGFPLEDLSTSFRSTRQRDIAVESMQARLLGGRLSADPFIFMGSADENRIVLHPESIQLPFIAKLAGFDKVTVEGSVSGEIPINIRGKVLAVTSGRLVNEPPGGVIRLDAGTAASATGESNVALASRALRNFQFDTLTSTVEYTGDGDLSLGMRISGINPDMDPTQPIIVNLNVEDNVPQLLRSLQAVRSIEEILERRAQRQ